jgi:hypothetical protein
MMKLSAAQCTEQVGGEKLRFEFWRGRGTHDVATSWRPELAYVAVRRRTRNHWLALATNLVLAAWPAAHVKSNLVIQLFR